MSHNQFEFIGNLTKDAKLSNAGQSPVATFDLAVDRVWYGADGQKQTTVDFFRIKCFAALATYAGKYLGNGSLVFVQGHIQPTKWEKDGQTYHGFDFIATKVVYLKTVEPAAETK